MRHIAPITITDALFVSSSIPDGVKVDNVYATGTITISAAQVAVAASGTLTATNAPGLGETFVVDTQTFTVVTTRSGTGEVTRGTGAESFGVNVATAINTDLSSVDATSNAGVVTITAATAGAAGNSIVFTEALANVTISPTGGYLSGGVDQDGPVAGETFVVDAQTFTFKASGTATGDVVLVTGTSNLADNIATSINRDIPGIVTATSPSNTVVLTSILAGTDGNDIVFTESVTDMTITGSGTLTGGVDEVTGDYYEWASGTTYADGALVVVTSEHTVYESLAGSNTGHTPSSSPTWWLSLGKTNRWKMCDLYVTSQSIQAESIVHACQPGAIDSVAILNCHAATVRIVLNDPVDGDVYDETITGTPATAKNYVVWDIPDTYPNATLTVTIANAGANATCGFLIPGNSTFMGPTLLGSEIEFIDYSIKEQDDEFGNWTIQARSWAKKGAFEVAVPVASRNAVANLLVDYWAIPSVWVGNDLLTDGNCTCMTIYGWIRNDPIGLGMEFDSLPFEIEGLI